MAKPWINFESDDKLQRPKPMSGVPVTLHNQVGAELGRVMEIQLDEHMVAFTRSRPKLIWFPGKRVLGWWHDLKDPQPSEDHVFALDDAGLDVGPAIAAFSRFNDRDASAAYTVHMPYRSTRAWYSIGPVSRIKYWSDKWGSSDVDYVHDFRAGTRLYIYGSPRPGGPSFWIIKGGSLRVGKAGID